MLTPHHSSDPFAAGSLPCVPGTCLSELGYAAAAAFLTDAGSRAVEPRTEH